MDSSKHIHRLSILSWFGYMLMGSFLLLLVCSTLAINARGFLSGDFGIRDYLGTGLMVFLMFPLGILLLTGPFLMKVVVKAHGLEYHTAIYILAADWKDLVNAGYIKDTPAGKTLVVRLRAGQLTLRNWAKPFRKILIQKPQGVRILVSQFGNSNGHSFETDILVNVSPHSKYSNEPESL